MAKDKKGLGPVVAMMPKEKPSARITLGKDMKLPALRVGKQITVEVTGRITNVNDDDYSRGFSMEITSCDTDTGMGKDMDDVKSKRVY